MKRAVLTTAFLLALAIPAAANQCPALMNQIDARLQTAQLPDADKARVMQLREEGEAAHKAGDHPKSEAALKEALDILK